MPHRRIVWSLAAGWLFLAMAGLPLRAAEPAGAVLEVPLDAAPGVVCPTPIAVEHVRPHVEYLAAADRNGRKGEDALAAANYVRDHFQQAGLRPLFKNDDYFQPIPGVLLVVLLGAACDGAPERITSPEGPRRSASPMIGGGHRAGGDVLVADTAVTLDVVTSDVQCVEERRPGTYGGGHVVEPLCAK